MTDLKNSGPAGSAFVRPTGPVFDFDEPTVSVRGSDQALGSVEPAGAAPAAPAAGSARAGDVKVTSKARSTVSRKVLRTLVAIMSVLVLGTVSVVGYMWFRFNQIPTAAIPKDPGVPPGGLPTIQIPLDGGTADGNAPATLVPGGTDTTSTDATAGSTAAAPPTAPPKPGDSIPDPNEGNLATPIATVKPLNGSGQFGPLLDTTGVAPLGGEGAKNYLMIGVDSRADIPANQKGAFGDVSGSRSDTIMLLRLNPSTDQAWVLSFPRDLYVRIAGTNQFNRLNAAYATSAGTLTSTLRENFNVPVDHFTVIDFVGFQKVVEALGGVTITFPKASRDTRSGLNQPAGRNLLDPVQATAYVRSRHFQEGENGQWHEDPRGDLGRIQRQQAFIRAVLSQAVEKVRSDPFAVNRLLTSLKDAITLDTAFGFGDIAKLASDLRSFDPNALQTFTVPNTPKRINKKDVVIVDRAKARQIVGQFGQRKTAGG